MVKYLIVLLILLCGCDKEVIMATDPNNDDLQFNIEIRRIGIEFTVESREEFIDWMPEGTKNVDGVGEDIVFNIGDKRYVFTADEFLDKLGIE